MNKGSILALIILLLACLIGGYYALGLNDDNTSITDIANNTTDEITDDNITENITLNSTEDNVTENVTVSTKKSDNTKKSVQKSSKKQTTSKSATKQSSDDEIKYSTFTVSKNEKGQNEGMEPGTYRMSYSAKEGPIDVQKID